MFTYVKILVKTYLHELRGSVEHGSRQLGPIY